MSESGHDSSETRSAIAAGTITITDEAAQKAHTGQTAEEVLASLNRDTAGAHQGPLAQNPDLQEILDKQAEIVDAAGKAGPAVAKTVGDITEKMYALTGDESWKEGGIYKALLQAAGSALVAQIGNGSGLDAALGAMASQLAAGKVKEIAREIAGSMATDPVKAALLAELIQNAASGAIGGAVGGETGSFSASNMDRYNRQLHPEETTRLLFIAQDFADKENISLEEALARLTKQALSQVDLSWALEFRQQDEAAAAFLDSHSGVFTVDGKDYTLFKANSKDEFLNNALYSEYIGANRTFYDRVGLIKTLVGGGPEASPAALAIGEATWDMLNMLKQSDQQILSVYNSIQDLSDYYTEAYHDGQISKEVYDVNIAFLDRAYGNINRVMDNIPGLASLADQSAVYNSILNGNSQITSDVVTAISRDTGMSEEVTLALVLLLSRPKNGKVNATVGASSTPKNIYNSIKEAPKYPDGFTPAKNGTTSRAMNNKKLDVELQNIERGQWKKIYKNGFDSNKKEISIHYFQSPSGKVYDVKVKNKWSE